MIPQANCKFKKVSGPGFSEDYDRAETAGSALWEGCVRAYYSERRRRVSTPEGSTIIIERSLVLDSEDAVDFSNGDTIVFSFKDLVREGKVMAIEERKIPSVPGTTRITLEDT